MYPTNTHESGTNQPGQFLQESSSEVPAGNTATTSHGAGEKLTEKAMETSSDPRALTRIRIFVESACGELVSPPLDEEQTTKMAKAAREVATNIIRHAYHGRASGTIRVEAEATSERLTVRIWHRAADFDPKLLAEPRNDGCGEGKFGVYIASQYTDDVQYFTDGQGTHCVSLITNTQNTPL